MDYLKDIYSEDIDLLLTDIELLKKGYELNYVIDPSDVFSYTFPYGLRFDNLGRSTEDIGDELIAYEYIFDHYRPIVFDEYRLELLLTRNSVKDSTDSRLKSDLVTVLAEDNPEGYDELIAQYSKNATFLLASAMMGQSFIKKFDEVYSNKLQTDRLMIRTDNVEDQKRLLEIFEQTRRSEWSKQTFTNWAKARHPNPDNNDIRLLKEFKSTFIDIIVIDRICRINETIQKNNQLNNKYIFLYYSGAAKSESIFDMDEVKIRQPEIDGIENYRLLRTPKHSYLLFLVYNSDLNIMSETLTRLKGIADKKKSNINLSLALAKITKTENYNDLVESLSKRKRELLDHSLINYQIKTYDKYKVAIGRKVARLQKEKEKDTLIAIYKVLLQEAKTANEEVAMSQMDLSYTLQSRLLHVVRLMVDKKDFTISKGKDQIRGTFHHLPILLFFDRLSKIENIREKILIDISAFVVQSKNMRQTVLGHFLSSIKNLYEEIQKGNVFADQYYDILINYFIYLLLETPDKDHSTALRALRDSFELLDSQPAIANKWADDYLYMLIWAYRRNDQSDKSLWFAEKGIKRFEHDPRFYHGKCLALYNMHVKLDTLDSCSDVNLLLIIDSAEKSIELYERALTLPDLYRSEYFPFINGNIHSIYNLLLYVVSLHYLDLIETKKEMITEITKRYPLKHLRDFYLSKIKEKDTPSKKHSKEFPEYLHTESILELVEAIDFFHKNFESDKILNALDAIGMALDVEADSRLYKRTKTKIDHWHAIIIPTDLK